MSPKPCPLHSISFISVDAELQEEERANKLALAAAKRTAEEQKIRAEAAERAKVEIDIQYRHVTEVNKEQTVENRELQALPSP